MGDEHEAEGFAAVQLLEKVNDVSFAILVEVAGRFIGKQQRRRIDQRTGDHHPTLLAARHAAGIGVSAVAEAYAREQVGGPRIGCFDSHCAPKKSRNGNVIHGGQVRQKARELEDKADVAATKDRAFFLRESPDISAIQQEFTRRRLGQGAEHRKQGRLARTGPADDRNKLAGLELEARAAHSLVA